MQESNSLAAGQPSLQVIVLPGNPGFCAFYAPFLAALHAQLGGRASVACFSHLGHHYHAERTCARVFTLAEQLAHQAALLRERALRPGGAPVALIGHSLGATAALYPARQRDEPAKQSFGQGR